MHEFSIIQGLIQQVEDYLDREHYRKVLKINLEVGEMSGVVQDALEFAYDVCSKGTRIDGAKLHITTVPVKAQCKTCKREFIVQEYYFSCPSCKSANLEIISGNELRIKEMEVD